MVVAGATTKGSFAQSPISKVAKKLDITTEKKPALMLIPALESNMGLSIKMCVIAKYVATPAKNSVRILALLESIFYLN